MAKFCPYCGNQLEDDALFCDACGRNLDAHPAERSVQAPQQPYGGAQQQFAQNPAQPQQGYYQPQQQNSQQQYPQQQYPQNAPQQPKKKTGLIIGLITGGAALTVAVIVILIVVITANANKKPNYGFYVYATEHSTQVETPTTAATGQVETPTEAPTQAPTVAPTQAPTQTPTQAPTSAPAPTAASAKLPYVDSLGGIKDSDFAWISDALSMQGSFISNDDLVGKWKAEFIFDGIWELVYITIDRDGTITVQPVRINYGNEWEDESGDPSYTFSGTFDINRVFGSGENGSIDLYQFLTSNGTEYALGELKAKTGYTAKVYLVRP